MRVMQLMAGGRHGGAETFFVDLVRALAGRGVAQLVVTRPFAERVTLLELSGAEVETAHYGGPLDLITGFRLQNAAARFAPDIALAWMNRAAAVMPRGAFVRVGRLGGYYDLKYYKRCDALVCNTADIRDYVIAGGWRADRAFHIPNFSPVEDAAPAARASLRTANDAKVVLLLARLERSKGIDTAIRALVDVPGAVLWIAGEGHEKQNLERFAAGLGVDDRVRFLGWRGDRSALLRAADICVVASRDEPFGNVVVNAWAHAVPLVATRARGPGALVRDGEDGLLVPIDDPVAMAAAINRVIGDKAFAQGIVSKGSARAAGAFSEEAVVGQYLDLFKALAASRGRPADLPPGPAGA